MRFSRVSLVGSYVLAELGIVADAVIGIEMLRGKHHLNSIRTVAIPNAPDLDAGFYGHTVADGDVDFKNVGSLSIGAAQSQSEQSERTQEQSDQHHRGIARHFDHFRKQGRSGANTKCRSANQPDTGDQSDRQVSQPR